MRQFSAFLALRIALSPMLNMALMDIQKRFDLFIFQNVSKIDA
jgi:hypothetical protein